MKKEKGTKAQVNLKKLIEVFDEHDNTYKGHTTPIIGLIGEDLNAAIFADYLIRRKKAKNVEILSYPVTTKGSMHRGGPELDRWIKADNILYQTEIKSWCCFQIGGYKLSLHDDPKKLANKIWKRESKDHYGGIQNIESLGRKAAGKVLVKMKISDEIKGYKKVKPLVIHWMPISNNEAVPFFSHLVKDLEMGEKLTKQIQKDFTEVNYFSCSLYIRQLISDGIMKLDLKLPNVQARMDIMEKLMAFKNE